MIADEQLIERLRLSMHAAAADVRPPQDLLDGIPAVRGRQVGLPSLGGLVIGLGAVSALAVAVLAIILLSHPRTPGIQPAAPQARPAPKASSLPELRAELAILRRPQRPADKIPAWGIAAEQRQLCSNCLNGANLIPGQTRLLASIRIPRQHAQGRTQRERVYLVLGTVPRQRGNGRLSGWRQQGRAIDGIHLSLVGLSGNRLVDELLNYTQMPVPAQALTQRIDHHSAVLPIGRLTAPPMERRSCWGVARRQGGSRHFVHVR